MVEVPALEFEELERRPNGESSADIKKRVDAARAIQRERFSGAGIESNARMTPSAMERYCQLDGEGSALMRAAFDSLGLTARSYDRILRVARTIADLDGSDTIGAMHLAEAIQYRTYQLK
jgi:magnesium chelatase family protein